jgi:hypothetical protein
MDPCRNHFGKSLIYCILLIQMKKEGIPKIGSSFFLEFFICKNVK